MFPHRAWEEKYIVYIPPRGEGSTDFKRALAGDGDSGLLKSCRAQ
jgi:hypothetical protein